MKYAFKITAFFLAFLCFSCSNEANEMTETNQATEAEQIQGEDGSQPVTTTVKYQCPKKCEGDKTCEEPLTCPVCNEGMEIIVEAKKNQ